MADYVQYHHPDNAPLHQSAAFAIYTAKPVDDRVSDRIRVITATKSPRQYFLAERFIADHATVRATPEDINTISGRVGQYFEWKD